MSCTRGRDKLVAGVAFSSVDQLRSLGYGERGSLINFRYMATYLGILKIVKGWNEKDRVVWIRIHFCSKK